MKRMMSVEEFYEEIRCGIIDRSIVGNDLCRNSNQSARVFKNRKADN